VRTSLLVAGLALLCACSRDIQNADAVRAGVLDYLTANQSRIGLDPNSMQIDVTSVSFQKDEARAAVAFRPKQGGDGGAPMMINYVLDRKGNKWVVRGRTESGANPHGGSSTAPQLPPGHPSAAAPDSQPPAQLPPGHPPIDSSKAGTKQ
jgi:hypothetical protein